MKKQKTKICKQCGAENPAESKFCQSCGGKIAPSVARKIFKWILIVIAVLCVLFVCVVIWAFLEVKKEDEANIQRLQGMALEEAQTNSEQTQKETQLVENLQLTPEERAEKEKTLQSKLTELKISTDTFNNVDFYYPKAMPTNGTNFIINERTLVLPFIKGVDNTYALLAKINYMSDDWLFIKSFEVNVDGNIIFDSSDYTNDLRFDKDNSDGYIYETYQHIVAKSYDSTVDEVWLSMLRKIANSQKSTIRFYGTQYYDDFVVSEKDKQSIKNILDTWDLLVELYGQ